jgi:rhodanese-related sulfurtransferase
MYRLSTLLLLSLLLVACNAQNNKTSVNTTEFISLADSIEVIDVRTPGEVSASYIDGTDYFFDINAADFKNNIASLDKNKPYIVYCRSGARSTNAINYMLSQGFTKLYELSGGILSWQDPSLLKSK